VANKEQNKKDIKKEVIEDPFTVDDYRKFTYMFNTLGDEYLKALDRTSYSIDNSLTKASFHILTRFAGWVDKTKIKKIK
jgi:hypothetical protein